jgi:hypothetical protein
MKSRPDARSPVGIGSRQRDALSPSWWFQCGVRVEVLCPHWCWVVTHTSVAWSQLPCMQHGLLWKHLETLKNELIIHLQNQDHEAGYFFSSSSSKGNFFFSSIGIAIICVLPRFQRLVSVFTKLPLTPTFYIPCSMCVPLKDRIFQILNPNLKVGGEFLGK